MENEIKNLIISLIQSSTLEGKGNICWDIHVKLVVGGVYKEAIIVHPNEIGAIYDEVNTPVEEVVEETPITEEV